MENKTISVAIEDHIAVVTINRPEKLNALNARTKEELHEAFASFKTDPGVLAVILTGAGDKAFVAGTDIGELTALDQESGRQFSLAGQKVFDDVENLGKPVIAAVNGYALGGGCELALACHLRVASEKAVFGQPEVNLGIIPGYGGTQRLARLIGRGRAMELILTGNHIPAQEAYRIGLVNTVVPHADLSAAARKLAALIAGKAPVAIRMALKAVNMTAETSLADGQQLEASLFGVCCGTADFREGTTAFLEKRSATFRGE
jgi:enoyl-CoA hydratase